VRIRKLDKVKLFRFSRLLASRRNRVAETGQSRSEHNAAAVTSQPKKLTPIYRLVHNAVAPKGLKSMLDIIAYQCEPADIPRNKMLHHPWNELNGAQSIGAVSLCLLKPDVESN